MFRRFGLLCTCLGLLGACTAAMEADTRARIDALGDPAPTPAAFHYCYGHGCAQRTLLALSPAEWAEVVAGLRGPAPDAATERERLALAAAAFERVVGRRAGTAGDRGGTFSGLGLPGQLDCVDETIDMTQFLTLLQGEGLLRFHRPGRPARRGNVIESWPHFTATIVETEGGGRFAVDSWFFDNGVPPLVIPLRQWEEGAEALVACRRSRAGEAGLAGLCRS